MIQQWHLRILWPFVFVIVFAFDVFVPLIVISSQNLEVNVVCNKMIAVVEAVAPKTFSDYFLKNLEKGLSSDFIFFAKSEHECP